MIVWSSTAAQAPRGALLEPGVRSRAHGPGRAEGIVLRQRLVGIVEEGRQFREAAVDRRRREPPVRAARNAATSATARECRRNQSGGSSERINRAASILSGTVIEPMVQRRADRPGRNVEGLGGRGLWTTLTARIRGSADRLLLGTAQKKATGGPCQGQGSTGRRGVGTPRRWTLCRPPPTGTDRDRGRFRR